MPLRRALKFRRDLYSMKSAFYAIAGRFANRPYQEKRKTAALFPLPAPKESNLTSHFYAREGGQGVRQNSDQVPRGAGRKEHPTGTVASRKSCSLFAKSCSPPGHRRRAH